MADLDYGYEITIETPGTSDPAETPTNQWQRKPEGGVWADISGETGNTYTVAPEDRASLIRLIQNFAGHKAASNELQVTDQPYDVDPCSFIPNEDSIQAYDIPGKLEYIMCTDHIAMFLTKQKLYYNKAASPDFWSESFGWFPDFGDGTDGKDYIAGIGRSNNQAYVLLTHQNRSYYTPLGSNGWIEDVDEVIPPISTGPFNIAKVVSDGNVTVAIGTNYPWQNSAFTYSEDGHTWKELLPVSNYPYPDLHGGDGFFLVMDHAVGYYNRVQGDISTLTEYTWPRFPAYYRSKIKTIGHLGIIHDNEYDKFYVHNPWTDYAMDVRYPWTEKAGQGYKFDDAKATGIYYTGGAYFATATKGIVMSSCNLTDWKMHRNTSQTSNDEYVVPGVMQGNNGEWYICESLGSSSSASYIDVP